MKDYIAEIEEKLKGSSLQHTPSEWAQIRARLAGEYSFVASRLKEVEMARPAVWRKMRADNKSDRATDRQWEATDMGINEIGLKWDIKRLEQMMNAVSGLVKTAEGEAKNNY